MKRPEAIIAGVGPGSERYLTERCRDLVTGADVLTGFSTPLEVVDPFHDHEPIVLTYDNQQRAISSIYTDVNPDDRVVVCCWGDPSVSDREFVERWERENFDVRIEPGVSSVMVACARVRIPLERSLFITFHKRGELDTERRTLLETVRKGNRHVIALPHPWDFMPSGMASWLLNHDRIPEGIQVIVLEELTKTEENIHSFTIRELAETDRSFSDLSIVVFKNST